MRHKNSRGNHGLITGRGAQWMTAGRGIVHSEMPEQEQGLLHGFQLWVNLPAREPIVQRGPFVMNTEDEIQRAFVDYRAGFLDRDG